jgi:TAG lipase/steryl ester hydrolase/phospholipase A2/LPA acyltransferase
MSKKIIAARIADLAQAPDYKTWREISLELDVLEGAEAWRQDDTSDDYDHLLIKERLSEMSALRKAGDVSQLVYNLYEGLHGNIGNIANPKLYNVARVGTKHLIEQYIGEVARCLDFLCAGDFPEFPDAEKIVFFKRNGSVFGRSALLLSGGATLGMFHLGVIKTLHEQSLLPRVISGSSAGSLIAGIVGTRDDEQLSKIFSPGGLNLQAFKNVSLTTMLKGGSVMDGGQLERTLLENIGTESFSEAFERTRRIIGVTVSPADPHQHGRLLNYLSAPHVTMSKAILASCAVPGIFPPVMLTAKDFRGQIVPYMPSKRWIDGTLASDLPMLRLARLHNCNHYIVSQTNPHIVPFMTDAAPKRGLLPLVKDLAKSGSRGALSLAREHMDPYASGRVIGKIDQLMKQKYTGDVNIFPRHTPKQLFNMFANLTDDDIQDYIRNGERATWPKLERIRNQTRISRMFDDCLLQLNHRISERSKLPRKQPWLQLVRQASGGTVSAEKAH